MSQPWFREPREHGVADGLQFTSTGALGSWAVKTLAPDSRAKETMGSECFHHQNIKYLEKNRACQEPLCHFLSGLQTKLVPGQCHMLEGAPSFPQSSVHSWIR